jgi:hypothetical protein
MKKGDQSLSTTLTLTLPAIVFSIFDMFVGCRHSRVEEMLLAYWLRLLRHCLLCGFCFVDLTLPLSPATKRHPCDKKDHGQTNFYDFVFSVCLSLMMVGAE